jgi:hypothetical protein
MNLNNFRCSILWASLLLVRCSLASADEIASGTSSFTTNDIRMTCVLTRTVMEPGTGLSAKVTIENLSDTAAALAIGSPPSGFIIEGVRKGTTNILYTIHGHKLYRYDPMQGPNGDIGLAAHGKYTRDLQISRFIDFSEAGTYLIKIKQRVNWPRSILEVTIPVKVTEKGGYE